MNRLLLIAACFLISCTTHKQIGDREPSAISDVFDKKAWEIIPTAEVKSYDTVFIASDFHAQFDDMIAILTSPNVQLVVEAGDWYKWNPAAQKKLFIVIGDMINKGPDGVGVVRLLSDLALQAKKYKSKVVLMWGNHEVEYLADTSVIREELDRSAEKQKHRDWLEQTTDDGFGDKIKPEELAESQFGKVMAELKMGAIVGTWLFAHAGYLNAKKSDVEDYIKKMCNHYNKDKFAELSDEKNPIGSVVTRHNWFRDRKDVEGLKEVLEKLGLEGVSFGHDPDAFQDYHKKSVIGEMAAGPGEWSLKTDTGMSADFDKPGKIAKCFTKDMFPGGKMRLISKDPKKPICIQVSAKKESQIMISNK